MSQNNKLSLWQKFKRMLTASAPQLDAHKSLKTADTTDIGGRDADVYTDAHSKSSEAKAKPTEEKSSERASTEKKSKVSLVKKSSSNTDSTPIVSYLKQYFDNKQWHYTYYRPRSSDSQQSHHLSLRMRNKQLDCGYLFRVQESNALLAVYGILPFLIPESHQSAALLLITQINYDMLIGNLEMDVNDGEIRYKNAIDVEAVGIDDDIIEHLLQSVIAMTTVAYEVFSDLINTQDPSDDMPTLLNELRQQADARTFFLPTQFVQ
ncbi:YbjN domain-containing protein [uncultured Psychrobacter sp.]|uniref:YbjN domain-containing protein n=1 Tax=uncultured Psychrobacter sp. TaxID=259303 RepID=UPI0034577BAC